MKIKAYFLIIPLIILTLSLTLLILSRPAEKNYDIRSKAASGNTFELLDAATGIQTVIDDAKDGDIITIPAGSYSSSSNCILDTKGKSLTLKGSGGVTLDGQNNGDGKVGICIQGGIVTIDNLRIHQTLGPAIRVNSATVIIKNLFFSDIDHTTIQISSGRALILNSLFAGSAGPGVSIGGNVISKIENNTFVENGGSGIAVNQCTSNTEINNNLIVDPDGGKGIASDCTANIKSLNNFVWKGKPEDGCVNNKPPIFDDCVGGEICTGVTNAFPYFIGADDQGTVCIYGEGLVVGDFHTRPNSPATQAGAGYGYGPCSDSNSTTCINYIEQQKALLQPPNPTSPPQPTNPLEYPTNPPEYPTTPPTQPTSPPGEPTYTPIPPNSTPPVDNNQPTTANPSTTLRASPQPTTPPTPTPTPKPLIDVKKTVETVQNTWNLFVASVIHFTQTVLP